MTFNTAFRIAVGALAIAAASWFLSVAAGCASSGDEGDEILVALADLGLAQDDGA